MGLEFRRVLFRSRRRAAVAIRGRGRVRVSLTGRGLRHGCDRVDGEGRPGGGVDPGGPTVPVGRGTGHLAEPLDVSDYAEGIATLLDDRERNKATGERAFE